jgi:hypothetical protein
MSGTSMSAPHIAGILALMVQKYPDADPAEIKARLMNTSITDLIKAGVAGKDASVIEVGAGFVDPYRAIMEEDVKNVYITVEDDIPGRTYNTVLEGKTLSSLSFGYAEKIDGSAVSRKLPVTVYGTSDFEISVIYNNNTIFSKDSSANNVILKFGTAVDGTFETWIEAAETSADGYYEGYLVVTDKTTGTIYTMPWLVEVGGEILPPTPFEGLTFISERPIISTSQDENIKSIDLTIPSPVYNSSITTIWFTWQGAWPIDSKGISDLDIFLIKPESVKADGTVTPDYYYDYVSINGLENDGTGLYRVYDIITDKAYKITDGNFSAGKETIDNGTYYLSILAGDIYYIIEEVGIVFTDGTGEYEVQLEMDSSFPVDDNPEVTLAQVKGRIYSPALNAAAEAGFLWTDVDDVWSDAEGFSFEGAYPIDQSFNILAYKTPDPIVWQPKSGDGYNYVNTVFSSFPICDENGYFDIALPVTQEMKNAGYVFPREAGNPVVGLEGFYYNWNGTAYCLIGANKSVTSVEPRYTTTKINTVTASNGTINLNMTNLPSEAISSDFALEYSANGGDFAPLIVTGYSVDDSNEIVTLSFKPIVKITGVEQNVIVKVNYLGQTKEATPFKIDAGIYVPPVDPDDEETGNYTPPTPPTPPTTPEPVVPVEFKDTPNHWAKDDIGFIAGLGLVNGTSVDNFSPDSNMNRGMIVTILGRLAKIDKSKFENSSSFNDVAGGQYYSPFVEWAAQLGLVNGTGNGGFSPEAPLTREQLAHMLMKYAELMNLNLKSNTENKVQFADEDKVSSYASESVQKARELGIIIGSDNNFAPERTITRAEVMTMLTRFIKLIEQQ